MNEIMTLTLTNTNDHRKTATLALPTDSSAFQKALTTIGADFVVSHVDSGQPAMKALLAKNSDALMTAAVDELNYAAVQLYRLDPEQLEKLNALAESPLCLLTLERLIDYPQNSDFFLLIPEVTNAAELGKNYAYHSGMVQMPDEWRAAIDCEKLGSIAAELEQGVFTSKGYLMVSGDEWEPHFEKNRDVPEQYRITPPQSAADKLPDRDR